MTTTTAMMKRRKKKGRPSKTSIPNSTPRKPFNYDSTPTTNRRSTRRNPRNINSPPSDSSDGGDGDDDDEREEKKVKLVVRLPQSEEDDKIKHSRDYDFDSDGESEREDREAKKRKINAVDRGSDGGGGGGCGGVSVQEKKVVKATITPPHGSPLESGPTTTLPDKKLLVFILDRLQKKDTYGVFSEPVDINELPDYFEVIEQPMDFGTVRKKLDNRVYKKLEELEADVFLICSNAMQYNAADTVYYRQARSIQEIAKRDFENLRHEGDNGEPHKIVRRGRPPSSKNQKKILEKISPVDRVGTDPSLGAALPSADDKGIGSNSYNLRKAPALNRFRSSDLFVSSYRPRNGENYSEWLADWNDEFPASILRADMKQGKKQQITVDENRRDTYKQFHPTSSTNNSSVLFDSIGDMKRLVPVGLQDSLSYARSLSRFAANLGPVAWKMAQQRIEMTLPSSGVQYGPGWVAEENEDCFSTENQKSSHVITPSTSDLNLAYVPSSEGLVEAVRKLNDLHENAPYTKTPFPVPPKPIYYHQSQRNGFGGMFGYHEGVPLSTQNVGPMFRNDVSSSHLSGMLNHFVQDEARVRENLNMLPPGYQITQGEGEMWSLGKSTWPAQQRYYNSNNNTLSVAPDLNLRIQADSPSSSLQIGSPQQPDLALQL